MTKSFQKSRVVGRINSYIDSLTRRHVLLLVVTLSVSIPSFIDGNKE